MQKFTVSALFKDPAEQKYNPEWEMEITSDFNGEALEKGHIAFQQHCVAQKLDYDKFELHVSTC